MMDALKTSGARLLAALNAENDALVALDMVAVWDAAAEKLKAAEAYAAAYSGCLKLGVKIEGDFVGEVQDLARDLAQAALRNKELLESSIGLQSRVIEVIAQAAQPAPAALGYGQAGASPRIPPLAVAFMECA